MIHYLLKNVMIAQVNNDSLKVIGRLYVFGNNGQAANIQPINFDVTYVDLCNHCWSLKVSGPTLIELTLI